MRRVRETFELVLEEETEDSEAVKLKLYRSNWLGGEEWIGLPRGQPLLVKGVLKDPKLFNDVVDVRTAPPAKLDLTMKGEYRDYQLPAIEALVKSNNGVLHMPPRMGKTVIAIGAAAELNLKTLIIAHQRDLIEQFCEETIYNPKLFGAAKSEAVAGICHVYEDFLKYRICLVTYQTFLSPKGQRLLQRVRYLFGLVIDDECLHPSHEVLTTRGWVNITEVTKEDLVAQVDPHTTELTYAHPERMVRKHFKGELVNLYSQKYDLLGTPNHEHLLYKRKKGNPPGVSDPVKIQFKDIPLNGMYETILDGNLPKEGPKNISAWERLLIAYQADGTYLHKVQSTGMYCYRFSFTKKRKIDRLEKILKELPYKRTRTTNSRGDTSFLVWLPLKIEKTLAWFLPYERSWHECRSFLDEVHKWDGMKRINAKSHGWQYYSTDKQQVDKVQEVAVSCGFSCSTSVYPPNKPQYGNRCRASWYKGGKRDITKTMKREFVPYEGHVYCLTMPKGTLVVRRNGKVSVTGNCHRLPGDRYMQIVSKFSAKYSWGLTGTPDRKDGRYTVSERIIGGVVHSSGKHKVMKPKLYGHFTELPRPKRRINHWTYLMSYIFRSDARNRQIAKQAVRDAKRGHTVLIPVVRKKHANDLETLINERAGRRICFKFTGDIPKDKRQQARDRMNSDKSIRVVIAMRSMLLGMNIPRLSACYTVAPISNVPTYTQEVFRVCTMLEGKRTPIIRFFFDTQIGASYGCFRTCCKTLLDPSNGFVPTDSFNKLLSQVGNQPRRYDYDDQSAARPAHGQERSRLKFL